MIKQQINLHQPIFRQQRAVFSALVVLRICAVWMVGLGVVYALALTREHSLGHEQASLTRSRDSTAARLQEFAASQDQPGRRQEQEAELARLQAELAQKQSVLRVLARGDLGDSLGFAPQIAALADRRLAGVWLNHIGLSAGGHEVSLHGQALTEDLLPAYIERLSGSEGLPGARFAEVRMNRAEDGGNIAFELQTGSGSVKP